MKQELHELTPDLLLQNLPVSEFMSDYWGKRGVYLPGAAYDGIPALRKGMDEYDAEELFASTSSENGVHVWLKDKSDKLNSIIVERPEDAARLHQAGHATYCRASPLVEQSLVSSFVSNLGLGCGRYDPEGGEGWGRGEVEVFCGTKGHFTDWHFDFQNNFTIQLSGSKKWNFREGEVPHPIRGATPHYKARGAVEGQLKAARLSDTSFQFSPPSEPTSTITMNPGDFMYFPAGMWHSVETLSPGMSLNIS
ncbi:hypothetical protein TrRE_jg7756, partial [Triparma retinervis]